MELFLLLLFVVVASAKEHSVDVVRAKRERLPSVVPSDDATETNTAKSRPKKKPCKNNAKRTVQKGET